MSFELHVRSKELEDVNNLPKIVKSKNTHYCDNLFPMDQVKAVEKLFEVYLAIRKTSPSETVRLYTNSTFIIDEVDCLARKHKVSKEIKIFYKDEPFKEKLGNIFNDIAETIVYLENL